MNALEELLIINALVLWELRRVIVTDKCNLIPNEARHLQPAGANVLAPGRATYLSITLGYPRSDRRKRVTLAWPAGICTWPADTRRAACHPRNGCVNASACNGCVTMTRKRLLSKCRHEPHAASSTTRDERYLSGLVYQIPARISDTWLAWEIS